MTNKELKADANALMDLEMMDAVVGGMHSTGCVVGCSESCFWSKKNNTTAPPTETPTPTKPTVTPEK